MDFRFTEDQLILVESIRDYFGGTHGPEVLRRLDVEGNRDPDIWQGLVDMGLTGLCVPEAHGGLGMGIVEAALIAAECGRVCLAEPLVDTAFVAVPWLIAKGETDKLSAIAAGDHKVALPHILNPWVADGEGKPQTSVDPLRNLAMFPASGSNDDRLLNLGALMNAAQLLGLADAMLEQAVEYAKIRTQFGQPVGAFQALKHQLASCAVAVEFAKPVVWRAAAAMQDGLETAPVHVSHAKIAASDAAMLTAETAIQVHGAMGYTWEVDLQMFMKRAWVLNATWGDRAFHKQRVFDALISDSTLLGPGATFHTLS